MSSYQPLFKIVNKKGVTKNSWFDFFLFFTFLDYNCNTVSSLIHIQRVDPWRNQYFPEKVLSTEWNNLLQSKLNLE